MGLGNLSPYAEPQDGAPSWGTGEKEATCVFLSLTLYIILDVNVAIYRIFKKKQGLYYWSLIFATWGTAVVALGNIFKNLKPEWSVIWPLWTLMINGGWSVYAPAECLVLYSRLHLVSQNDRLHRWLLIMIIVGSFLVIVPNWVFVFPAYDPNHHTSSIWSPRMAIIDRISQAVFTFFELIISSIYIHSLLGILRTKLNIRTRRVMRDLICVNVTVITMDLLVIVLIFLNLVNLAYPLQDFTYAFKFKIEFAVLNQLMAVATLDSRSNRRAPAVFEERRYQRPGTTLLLKGYADDDIAGVPLRLASCTKEEGFPKDLATGNIPQQPQVFTSIDRPGVSGAAKPSRLAFRARDETRENSTSPELAAEPEKPYDVHFAFSSGPSLELSPSVLSSRDGSRFPPDTSLDKDSDDALLAPVADDHDEKTLANVDGDLPLRHRQRRRQRHSLRQILFGRKRTPEAHEEVRNHDCSGAVATVNPGPLAGYSPPESIGHLADSSGLTPPPPPPPPPPPQHANNRDCGDSDSDDEGLHTWERRSRIVQEVPWLRKAKRPSVHRSMTS